MTDSRMRALSAALEYHKAVDPASWNYPQGMMGGGGQYKHGGSYAPEGVVKTAAIFAAFLDGETPRKRRK